MLATGFKWKICIDMTWDRSQITALAPDAASIKAASKLTSVAKWPLLEYSERAVWGHCQGSGKKPYLTTIDLSEPAFKCSCPSRKFPCKHALALFVLYAEQQQDFSQNDSPDWVSDWLSSRDKRQETKAKKQTSAKPVDEKAQQKRAAERAQSAANAVTDLKLWLGDMLHSGLAEVVAQPYSYWQQMSKRMVDAKAVGLANRVKRLGEIAASGSDGLSMLSLSIGQLNLLLNAYERLESLPNDIQQDVRQVIGFTINEQQLIAEQTALEDKWLVLSRLRYAENNLINQMTWLQSCSDGRTAMVLEFAHRSALGSLSNFLAGAVLSGSFYYYPSASPVRGRFVGNVTVNKDSNQSSLPVKTFSLGEMLNDFAKQKTLNPWFENQCYCLSNVAFSMQAIMPDLPKLPIMTDCSDESSKTLMATIKHCDWWRLLALSGGMPVTAAVSFDGMKVRPLGVWVGEVFYHLAEAEQSQ